MLQENTPEFTISNEENVVFLDMGNGGETPSSALLKSCRKS